MNDVAPLALKFLYREGSQRLPRKIFSKMTRICNLTGNLSIAISIFEKSLGGVAYS